MVSNKKKYNRLTEDDMQLSSIMCRGMDVIGHDRDYKIHDTTLKLIENYIRTVYNTMCQCG